MINVISLGAGKQSSYMLLNALEGRFKFNPDFAIFSDTGCEPDYVYQYLNYLKERTGGFKIITVSRGNLMTDIEDYCKGKTNRVSQIPLHLDNAGLVMRQCTADYKLQPIRNYLNSIRKKERVRLWIGISLDEIERVKDSPVKYIEHYYPLIENRISIDQIINYFETNKIPEPGKSACLICPFHSFEYWSQLKRFSGVEFERACQFDDLIRDYPKLNNRAYLSRFRKPLKDIDFSQHPSLFPELIEECHGMCGL